MLLWPEFDYHLTDVEKSQVLPFIPPDQSRIHMIFRCNMTLNRNIYGDCACVLTEHRITTFIRSGVKSSLKLCRSYHLLSLTSLVSQNTETTEFQTLSDEVLIYSTVAVRFARSVVRNYLLTAPLWPASMRMKLISHAREEFPPYQPILSLAQRFQFQYFGACSESHAKYCHEIVRHYHTMLKSCDPIFDLNSLPPWVPETVDFGPAFDALMYSGTVFGVNCENLHEPELVKSAASLIAGNPDLVMIRLVNVGATSGCKDIATGLMKSSARVAYWDLSGNELSDIDDLTEVWMNHHVNIAALKLEDCGIGEESMDRLLRVIQSAWQVENVREFGFAGNYISEEGGKSFGRILEEIGQEDGSLDYLSFGPAEEVESITSSLHMVKIPLRHLKLVDMTIGLSCCYDLAGIVAQNQTLQHLELISCEIADDGLNSVLEGFVSNKSAHWISIGLDSMQVKKERFNLLMKMIVKGLGAKIVGLSLRDNSIGQKELESFVKNIKNLPFLSSLCLAENFNDKNQIGSKLAKLVHLPSLTCLDIHGSDNARLKSASFVLLNELCQRGKLEELDISGNEVGPGGIQLILKLLHQTKTLKRIKFKGNGPVSIEQLDDYFKICGQKLIAIDLPLMEECGMSESYIKARERVSVNRAKLGLVDKTFLQNDRVLRDAIDCATLKMHEALESDSNLYNHSCLAYLLGLSFPCEAEHRVPDIELDRENEREYASALYANFLTESGQRSVVSLYDTVMEKRPNAVENYVSQIIQEADQVDEEEEETTEEEDV